MGWDAEVGGRRNEVVEVVSYSKWHLPCVQEERGEPCTAWHQLSPALHPVHENRDLKPLEAAELRRHCCQRWCKCLMTVFMVGISNCQIKKVAGIYETFGENTNATVMSVMYVWNYNQNQKVHNLLEQLPDCQLLQLYFVSALWEWHHSSQLKTARQQSHVFSFTSEPWSQLLTPRLWLCVRNSSRLHPEKRIKAPRRTGRCRLTVQWTVVT